MLFLVFQIAADRYALDTAEIVEVLPLLVFKQIPQSPPGVLGVFNYHGAPVPLLDLAEFSSGNPARRHMSTRIILVRSAGNLLGLVAEQATAMIRRAEDDFVDAGVAVDEAPYLGRVTNDSAGIIQRIEVNQLLPSDVRDRLFRQAVEAA